MLGKLEQMIRIRLPLLFVLEDILCSARRLRSMLSDSLYQTCLLLLLPLKIISLKSEYPLTQLVVRVSASEINESISTGFDHIL